MQAYDKKKSINEDFDRPSFILPGFPDGFFDTQPLTGVRADGAGTSGEKECTKMLRKKPW